MKPDNYIPSVTFHPGEVLAEKLTELNMSNEEFARLSSIPKNIIEAIIEGECSVIPDITENFECITKIPTNH